MAVIVASHAQPLPASPFRAVGAARLGLVAGFVAVAALAALAAGWMPAVPREADLERMLRGMGMIKAVLACAGLAIVFWRLGHPVGRRVAGAYTAAVWLAAGSAVLVWQLAAIPLAALLFHVAELTFLIAAWRDARPAPRRPA